MVRAGSNTDSEAGVGSLLNSRAGVNSGLNSGPGVNWDWAQELELILDWTGLRGWSRQSAVVREQSNREVGSRHEDLRMLT